MEGERVELLDELWGEVPLGETSLWGPTLVPRVPPRNQGGTPKVRLGRPIGRPNLTLGEVNLT